MAKDPDTLVRIATFDHDWQAHIAKGLLEEHDIPSIINNEILSTIYPIGFNTIGGVTLSVFNRDASRALSILSSSGDLNFQ